ncbi:hypothetical protein G8A07_26345 [Roseateles sp. DAIF2]|uniref:hypothetical protein n=1 Tax=Roseateles sp. DAIF2 TaxID=2714952 RepID=UPI0018A2B586|nr:hypothetical protein [Roseateles sp. DAIF2]QPF76099.1 hypothetical protein G8A07_26345 [Roseateles sp. DAIF2]
MHKTAAAAAAVSLSLIGPLLAAGAWAQPKGGGIGAIYSCVTADGRRLTSDRLISECNSREQRILNADGSLRAIVPPAMSPEERAAYEARERKAALERAALQDAVRRDRNLMQRYRNEAAHQAAREAALDDVNKAMQVSEKRVQELATERKPLLDEAEFYKGKAMPAKLRQQLDANEVAAEAQRVLIDNQKAELVRVSKLYDIELARLKRLWAGAPPGSLD